jgi:cullin-4
MTIQSVSLDKEGDDLLREFVELYDLLYYRLSILEKVFLYLDRTYLLYHPTKKTIKEYGLLMLYEQLLSDGLWETLFQAFSDLLVRIRCGDGETNALEVHFWKRYFTLTKWNNLEQRILTNILEFCRGALEQVKSEILMENQFDVSYRAYRRECDLWTRCGMAQGFIEKVNTTMMDKLVLQCYDDELKNHSLRKVISSMLTHAKYNSSRNLFLILRHKAESEPFVASPFPQGWSDFIITYVKETIENVTTADFVQKLVDARKYLDSIRSQYFGNADDLEFSMRDSFQKALSDSSTVQVNQKLEKCIDTFMKSHEVDTVRITEMLESICGVFKAIRSKEQFIKLYQRDLSKRLIQNYNLDLNAEMRLLQLLEQEVSPDLIQPLITMINDIKRSEEISSGFFESIALDTSIDFRPLVLNSQAWPIHKGKSIIPDDLSTLLTEFQTFYLSDKEHQKIQWCPAMSSMTILTHFKYGVKELQVTQFQALLLLLFNEHDELTFETIKQQTGMDSNTLTGALYSLTNGRFKILLKGKSGYKVNEEFQDKKRVIKIRQIQMRLKTNGDAEEIEDDEVQLDRDDSVKAFVIRFMKQHDTCKHDVLFDKVLEKYAIQRDDIKRIVGDLISMDYLGRWNGLEGYKYIP